MMQDLVLTFHGIGSPPTWVPEAERPYWMPKADFLAFVAQAGTLARDLDLHLTASFDDGNLSDLEIAAPALHQHAIAGIFFPCSGRIGRPGYLSANNLRSLADQGFGIGSHGVDHLPWASLDPATLANEVKHSKTAIETLLGRTIATAALPFGSYNRQVLTALRAAGYSTVYSSDPGLAQPGALFQRRWSYKTGMDFDLKSLARQSRDPVRRIVSAAKHLIKSLR
jgi:peptidoglycan/xylan/chitin deacetylase (PgdA/CDA1 family)